MNSVSVGLQFVVLVILIYFIYNSLNLLYTIHKQKKEDPEMISMMSTLGNVVIYGSGVIVVAGIVGAIVFEVMNIMANGVLDANYWPLDIAAFVTILYFFFFLSQLFFVGKKRAVIGRVAFDKRKMKRPTIKGSKFHFAYAQSTFSTNIWFVNEELLNKEMRRMG